MDKDDIASYRMVNQQIVGPPRSPVEVVSALGALQAQTYIDALWAVGLRSKNTKQAQVEDAIAKKRIIRTWAMRGTWHFVPPSEVRWMLSLYPEDTHVPSYHKKSGLTDAMVERGLELIPKVLKDSEGLTYDEIGKALGDTGVPQLKDHFIQRHIIRRAGKMGIICFGGHKGRNPTFTLLDKSAPKAKPLGRAAVVEKLAKVYFESHGPATAKDFAWWSGVRLSDISKALDVIAPQLREEEYKGERYWMPKRMPKVKAGRDELYLLPSFDEYLIAYRDRSAIIDGRYAKLVINGSTFQFSPIVVFNGHAIGTWRRLTRGDGYVIETRPFTTFTSAQKDAIAERVERYAAFTGKKTVLE